MKGYLYVALDTDAYVEMGYTQDIKQEEKEKNITIYATVEVFGENVTSEEVTDMFPTVNKHDYRSVNLKCAFDLLNTFSKITGGEFKEYHDIDKTFYNEGE